MKTASVLGLLAIVVAFVACFTTPDWKDGTIKCNSDDMRACPGGATCVAGFCYHDPDFSIVHDASVDFSPHADLGTAD
jgi:hypothetical protein